VPASDDVHHLLGSATLLLASVNPEVEPGVPGW